VVPKGIKRFIAIIVARVDNQMIGKRFNLLLECLIQRPSGACVGVKMNSNITSPQPYLVSIRFSYHKALEEAWKNGIGMGCIAPRNPVPDSPIHDNSSLFKKPTL